MRDTRLLVVHQVMPDGRLLATRLVGADQAKVPDQQAARELGICDPATSTFSLVKTLPVGRQAITVATDGEFVVWAEARLADGLGGEDWQAFSHQLSTGTTRHLVDAVHGVNGIPLRGPSPEFSVSHGQVVWSEVSGRAPEGTHLDAVAVPVLGGQRRTLAEEAADAQVVGDSVYVRHLTSKDDKGTHHVADLQGIGLSTGTVEVLQAGVKDGSGLVASQAGYAWLDEAKNVVVVTPAGRQTTPGGDRPGFLSLTDTGVVSWVTQGVAGRGVRLYDTRSHSVCTLGGGEKVSMLEARSRGAHLAVAWVDRTAPKSPAYQEQGRPFVDLYDTTQPGTTPSAPA